MLGKGSDAPAEMGPGATPWVSLGPFPWGNGKRITTSLQSPGSRGMGLEGEKRLPESIHVGEHPSMKLPWDCLHRAPHGQHHCP